MNRGRMKATIPLFSANLLKCLWLIKNKKHALRYCVALGNGVISGTSFKLGKLGA